MWRQKVVCASEVNGGWLHGVVVSDESSTHVGSNPLKGSNLVKMVQLLDTGNATKDSPPSKEQSFVHVPQVTPFRFSGQTVFIKRCLIVITGCAKHRACSAKVCSTMVLQDRVIRNKLGTYKKCVNTHKIRMLYTI